MQGGNFHGSSWQVVSRVRTGTRSSTNGGIRERRSPRGLVSVRPTMWTAIGCSRRARSGLIARPADQGHEKVQFKEKARGPGLHFHRTVVRQSHHRDSCRDDFARDANETWPSNDPADGFTPLSSDNGDAIMMNDFFSPYRWGQSAYLKIVLASYGIVLGDMVRFLLMNTAKSKRIRAAASVRSDVMRVSSPPQHNN